MIGPESLSKPVIAGNELQREGAEAVSGPFADNQHYRRRRSCDRSERQGPDSLREPCLKTSATAPRVVSIARPDPRAVAGRWLHAHTIMITSEVVAATSEASSALRRKRADRAGLR